MPDCVGVPLILIVSAAHVAVIPAGRFVAVPIPVATVVVCVITMSGVLIHRVGVEEAADAVVSTTVIVPVALMLPQPPVNGIV